MSSQQQSIADYVTAKDSRPTYEGARYNWSAEPEDVKPPEETGKCLNCGNHVTKDFARVFGNNDDAVHACTSCTTARDLFEGGAWE